MRTLDRIAFGLAWIACCGMVSPAAVFGSQPQTNNVQDVALTAGGAFSGQIVDAQGNGLAGVPVTVANASGKVTLNTSADGRFQVTNLNGGVLQIAAGDCVQTCRVWTASTAPPVATSGLLMVSNNNVVRGQGCANGGCATPGPAYAAGPVMDGGYMAGPACGPGCDGCSTCGGGGGFGGGVMGLVSNPWFVGAVVAAAIAIPLAVDDDDDAS